MLRRGLCLALLLTMLPGALVQARATYSAGTDGADFAIAPGTPILRHQHPQPYFQLRGMPGQTSKDVVAILNRSRTTPLSVRWQVFAAVTPLTGGGISLASTSGSLARWLRLSRSTSTIAPQQVAFIPFTVQIPRAALPGEYLGAISAAGLTPLAVSQGKMRYKIMLQRQVTVLLRVLGRARAGLRVVKAAVNVARGQAVLALTLANTGTVIDAPTNAVLRLTGPNGARVVHPAIGPLTAGATTTIDVPLSGAVAAGRYSIDVQMRYLAHLVDEQTAASLQTRWHGSLDVLKGTGG